MEALFRQRNHEIAPGERQFWEPMQQQKSAGRDGFLRLQIVHVQAVDAFDIGRADAVWQGEGR